MLGSIPFTEEFNFYVNFVFLQDGNTALHLCVDCLNGDVEICEPLLQAGAEVLIKNKVPVICSDENYFKTHFLLLLRQSELTKNYSLYYHDLIYLFADNL